MHDGFLDNDMMTHDTTNDDFMMNDHYSGLDDTGLHSGLDDTGLHDVGLHGNDDFQTISEYQNMDGSTHFMQGDTLLDSAPPESGYFHDGHQIIHEYNPDVNQDNMIVDGKVVSHNQDNVMGGTDVYHGNDLVYHTAPNGAGGENIFDSHMNQVAMSVNNGAGGLDYIPMTGNAHDILDYADPLEHVNDYVMDKLDLSDV